MGSATPGCHLITDIVSHELNTLSYSLTVSFYTFFLSKTNTEEGTMLKEVLMSSLVHTL